MGTQSVLTNSFILELLFCGAVGLLSIFIFLLLIKSGEKLYFYYFLFLLCSFFGAYINIAAFNWENDFQWVMTDLAKRNLEVVTLFGLFTYCLFTLELLNAKKQDERLYRWIVALASITFIYGGLYWLFYTLIKPHANEFFIGSRIIILPMSLLAIIGVSYKIQSVFKTYFMLGSIFYLVGATFGVLRETVQNIPLPYFYQLSASAYFYAGIFLEIICFSLALNQRVYLLHKSQEQLSEDLKKKAFYERDLALIRIMGSEDKSNPHFIFNQFTLLKYLIQRQKNRKAVKLLTTYSQYLRKALELGTKQSISLQEELVILRQYVSLESFRLRKNFSFYMNIDPNVDTEFIFLPPITFQPFIEKLFWREFQVHNQNKKSLNLTVKSIDSKTAILVEISAQPSKKPLSESKFPKHGSEDITSQRMKLYNRNHINKIKCYRKETRDNAGILLSILLWFSIN